jgi:glucosamine 6-phosphate synthetase-like amidotransferase/phosphosugar isomerase protein
MCSSSDTDTEVLVHLIDDIQRTEKVELAEAVRLALASVVGAYAIVVIDRNAPDVMVAARKSSPLVIGIGEKGNTSVPAMPHPSWSTRRTWCTWRMGRSPSSIGTVA